MKKEKGLAFFKASKQAENKIGVPLLQVILVNKSNDVAFFVIGVPAYRVILLV